MATETEKDSVTGTETTGHEWDGIKELNSPLPKWWIIIFWLCVAWSGLYYIVYPTFPGWDGLWEYTARKDLDRQMAALQADRAIWLDKLSAASMDDIKKDGDLLAFAMAGGRASFADNCAPCHGSGAAGGPGYPNLLDDSWIWGGTLDDIQTTVAHGVRWAKDDDTRVSDMPRFGVDELLDKTQINEVADHVLSLTGGAAATEAGAEIFAENCAGCHGESGEGMAELGAPRLSDAIWLYGGDKATLVETISKARGGVMPAWGGRLDEVTVKQLAVYVHSLGGGQ
ncbi:MAG: cytochrome-c oxidase, cbb3-type subunit III [Proteobacteria bacterium]|nr:cytochrome-c oxidase, cbb3-type subunit III [Pseudomonadota bacterium]